VKLKDVLDVDLEEALFEEVADLFLHLLVVLDVPAGAPSYALNEDRRIAEARPTNEGPSVNCQA